MDQPGVHGRHRDKNGELSKKHGNTLVRTLRKLYGQHFAEGCAPEERLSDVLQKLDEPSLSRLYTIMSSTRYISSSIRHLRDEHERHARGRKRNVG